MMRGWVSGVVRVFVRVCVCEFLCVCVWCVRGEGVRVGDWMRGGLLEWHGGSFSWVKHGNMDTELL